jgi:hypothetical protein
VIARSTPRAVAMGVLAALAVALVYGFVSEPLELVPSLLAIAFFGGWLIGHAVSHGAWSNREHDADQRMQWTALALTLLAWIGALVLAFTVSQTLIPDSSLPLSTRLTVDNFFGYLGGLEFVPVIHLVSLTLMAFMAWRGAR